VGPGLPVNGALATTQDIDGSTSVAPDGNGGFYIASPNQNRVYRVAADGRLSFVAGNGIRGFSGDGGPATSAQLDGPIGVAVDSEGNLFIVDTGNSGIRKVTPDGIISTVAGNGTKAPEGSGHPLFGIMGVPDHLIGEFKILNQRGQFRCKMLYQQGVELRKERI
jgi:DNA-binding beta-propeller fold protein YncE